MEERDEMQDLVVLMSKIDEAMEMTRGKQEVINNMKNELREETRPVMVEEGKEKISAQEESKREFDEMTKESLIRAKASILQLRKQTEKEYQDKLVATMEKKKSIQAKLESMKARGMNEEKLSMAQSAAEKALTNTNKEMEEYQKKHFIKRAKLDEFEANISNYAMELGVEQEIENVSLEEDREDTKKRQPASEDREQTSSEEQEMADSEEQLDTEKTEQRQPAPVKPAQRQPAPAKPAQRQPAPAKPAQRQPAPAKPAQGKQEPAPNKTNNKRPVYIFKGISCSIEDNQPVYRIIIEKDKGERVESIESKEGVIKLEDLAIKGFDNLKTLTPEQQEELSKQFKERNAKKVDPNVAELLSQLDEKFGMQELKKYKTMVTTQYSKGEKAPIKISYDFSELYQNPQSKEDKAKLKQLKRIARANYKDHTADYEKQPNWLKRLWKQMTQPKLPKGESETPAGQSSKKEQEEHNKPDVEQEVQVTAEKPMTIEEIYAQQYDEGIDIEEFIKAMQERDDMTAEKAEQLRAMHKEYEELGKREDPYKAFRKKVQGIAEQSRTGATQVAQSAQEPINKEPENKVRGEGTEIGG